MSDVSAYKPQQAGTNGPDRETDLTQQARTLGHDLKNKASELADTVTRTAKDQVAELSTAAKDLASDASGKIQGKIQTAMNDQKNVGADYMGNIAQAIRRAAGELEGDVPQAAQYVRQAAGQIDTVAKAVRERDLGELVSEVRQFARRQPTAFFGGAVVLGFAAIRFFKSSGSSDGNSGQRNAQNERSAAQSPQAASSISASDGSGVNASRSR